MHARLPAGFVPSRSPGLHRGGEHAAALAAATEMNASPWAKDVREKFNDLYKGLSGSAAKEDRQDSLGVRLAEGPGIGQLAAPGLCLTPLDRRLALGLHAQSLAGPGPQALAMQLAARTDGPRTERRNLLSLPWTAEVFTTGCGPGHGLARTGQPLVEQGDVGPDEGKAIPGKKCNPTTPTDFGGDTAHRGSFELKHAAQLHDASPKRGPLPAEPIASPPGARSAHIKVHSRPQPSPRTSRRGAHPAQQRVEQDGGSWPMGRFGDQEHPKLVDPSWTSAIHSVAPCNPSLDVAMLGSPSFPSEDGVGGTTAQAQGRDSNRTDSLPPSPPLTVPAALRNGSASGAEKSHWHAGSPSCTERQVEALGMLTSPEQAKKAFSSHVGGEELRHTPGEPGNVSRSSPQAQGVAQCGGTNDEAGTAALTPRALGMLSSGKKAERHGGRLLAESAKRGQGYDGAGEGTRGPDLADVAPHDCGLELAEHGPGGRSSAAWTSQSSRERVCTSPPSRNGGKQGRDSGRPAQTTVDTPDMGISAHDVDDPGMPSTPGTFAQVPSAATKVSTVCRTEGKKAQQRGLRRERLARTLHPTKEREEPGVAQADCGPEPPGNQAEGTNKPSFQVSRSGRILVRPLAYWANQALRSDNMAVAIDPGFPDQLFASAAGLLVAPKQGITPKKTVEALKSTAPPPLPGHPPGSCRPDRAGGEEAAAPEVEALPTEATPKLSPAPCKRPTRRSVKQPQRSVGAAPGVVDQAAGTLQKHGNSGTHSSPEAREGRNQMPATGEPKGVQWFWRQQPRTATGRFLPLSANASPTAGPATSGGGGEGGPGSPLQPGVAGAVDLTQGSLQGLTTGSQGPYRHPSRSAAVDKELRSDGAAVRQRSRSGQSLAAVDMATAQPEPQQPGTVPGRTAGQASSASPADVPAPRGRGRPRKTPALAQPAQTRPSQTAACGVQQVETPGGLMKSSLITGKNGSRQARSSRLRPQPANNADVVSDFLTSLGSSGAGGNLGRRKEPGSGPAHLASSPTVACGAEEQEPKQTPNVGPVADLQVTAQSPSARASERAACPGPQPEKAEQVGRGAATQAAAQAELGHKAGRTQGAAKWKAGGILIQPASAVAEEGSDAGRLVGGHGVGAAAIAAGVAAAVEAASPGILQGPAQKKRRVVKQAGVPGKEKAVGATCKGQPGKQKTERHLAKGAKDQPTKGAGRKGVNHGPAKGHIAQVGKPEAQDGVSQPPVKKTGPQAEKRKSRELAVPESGVGDQKRAKGGHTKAGPSTKEGAAASDDDAREGNHWTVGQLAALEMAYYSLEPTQTDFWRRVAARVPGKSAADCCNRKFDENPTPPAASRPPKPRQYGHDCDLVASLAGCSRGGAIRKPTAAVVKKVARQEAWQVRAEAAQAVSTGQSGAAPPPNFLERAAAQERTDKFIDSFNARHGPPSRWPSRLGRAEEGAALRRQGGSLLRPDSLTATLDLLRRETLKQTEPEIGSDSEADDYFSSEDSD